MVSGTQILFYIDNMDDSLAFYKKAIGLEPVSEASVRCGENDAELQS
jgi:hypothetical protein